MKELIRPTLILSLLNLGNMLVSLATGIILASLFGAKEGMDAYLAANLLPVTIYAVFSGSLGVVIIPIFIRYRAKGERHAWQLAGNLMAFSGVALGLISVFGALFRRSLLTIFVPGLSPIALGMATDMALVLWLIPLLGGFTVLLSALKQAEGKFVWQAVVPLVGSLVSLGLVVALAAKQGVYILAIATTAGFGVQLGLLLPTVLGAGRHYLRLSRDLSGTKETSILLAPLVASRLLSNASVLVDRYLASFLGVGSISRLAYVNRSTAFAVGLLSPALSTTVFPLMAQHVVSDDVNGLRRTFWRGISVILLFYAPVVAIGSVLARPFFVALFERGQFTRLDTYAVAGLLPLYLVAMLAGTLGDMTSRVLYAGQRTKVMAALHVLSMIVYASLALLLVPGWGLLGLAAATAINAWISLALQLGLIWALVKPSTSDRVQFDLIRIALATCLSAMFSFLAQNLYKGHDFGKFLGGGLVGLVAYTILLVLFRVPELELAKRMLLTRFSGVH